MRSSLQFLGGAGTVTGSKFLLRLGADAFLIDCGLFQGLKELRLQNWAPFPVDAREISYKQLMSWAQGGNVIQ
jgi:metallo-beta-lactamase family protein